MNRRTRAAFWAALTGVTALFDDWQAAVFGEALAYFNGTFDSAISDAGASPLWEWGAAGVTPIGRRGGR